jgi:hypothetical protein
MTAPTPALDKTSEARERLKAVEHSLYFGRERLGRYVQLGHKRFKAFDADDRPLGKFCSRTRALAAIRKAWARPGKNGTTLLVRHPTHLAATLAKADSRTRELGPRSHQHDR